MLSASPLHFLLFGLPSQWKPPGRRMENATSQACSPAGTWLGYHVRKVGKPCLQARDSAAPLREVAVSWQTTPRAPHNGWAALQVLSLGTVLGLIAAHLREPLCLCCLLGSTTDSLSGDPDLVCQKTPPIEEMKRPLSTPELPFECAVTLDKLAGPLCCSCLLPQAHWGAVTHCAGSHPAFLCPLHTLSPHSTPSFPRARPGKLTWTKLDRRRRKQGWSLEKQWGRDTPDNLSKRRLQQLSFQCP